MTPAQTIRFSVPAMPMVLLMPLLGSGVKIRTRLGTSLETLLCQQLGIDPGYLKDRIQTILVNSRAVDHVSRTIIADGDTVALSAAMPGLVGTTLRRGGHLAAMRAEISQKNDGQSAPQNTMGVVTVKLFNTVARDIGPQVLSAGILLAGRDAARLVEKISPSPMPTVTADPAEWVEVGISIRPGA